MRSLLSAFGLGAGLALLGLGAVIIAGPRFIDVDSDGDAGVMISTIGDQSSGSFQISEGGVRFSAKWRGEFGLSADARALLKLEDHLEVERREGALSSKAVFEKSDSGIKVVLYRDGKAAPAGGASDNEAGDLLQRFARASGVNADERLKAIIADGGKAAALAEIETLSSGHAVASYVEALSKIVTLTDADIATLAARVGKLESDYSKRLALSSMLVGAKPGDAALADVIAVAKTIEGDHELRLIVETLAEQKASAANLAAATALIAEIESDHETRLAVTAILESAALSAADAATAIDAAIGKIDSDHELRLIVETAAEKAASPEVAAAATRMIDAIESDHDRRLAIESLADALPAQSGAWPALVNSVKGIDSDHDRRLAIETLAAKAPDSADIADGLKKSAEAIGSDHDRRLALDALSD
jgi:hypothetical protein